MTAAARPARSHVGVVGWLAVGVVVSALFAVTATGSGPSVGPVPTGAPATSSGYAVADPPRLRGPAREPALLVVGEPARRGMAQRVGRVTGVRSVERVGVGSLSMLGRSVTAAAVDPSSYRRLAQPRTANDEAVWDAVARGDAAMAHGVVGGLGVRLGASLPVGSGSPGLPLGAVASTLPGIDLVVNRLRGAAMGLPVGNGVVVSLRPDAAVGRVGQALERALGRAVSVSVLSDQPSRDLLAARLVGGDVAAAVGSFSYRWLRNGTVRPDPAWAAASLVTGEVPILGAVTCHRVMLPPLRGALLELRARGLGGTVDPSDFGGCYAPRFIDRDPQRGLSLHTWGIAVDLNVSGNRVGTAGTLDPRVVETFERWGFAWGGRWRVPDPMHFELAALVTPS